MIGKPEVREVRVGDLLSDESYCRQVDRRFVEDIKRGFIRPYHLEVSERADGSLWLIDGRRVLTALKELEGPDAVVSAYVFTGLTVQEEADLFIGSNTTAGRSPYKWEMLDLVAQAREGNQEAISRLAFDKMETHLFLTDLERAVKVTGRDEEEFQDKIERSYLI